MLNGHKHWYAVLAKGRKQCNRSIKEQGCAYLVLHRNYTFWQNSKEVHSRFPSFGVSEKELLAASHRLYILS